MSIETETARWLLDEAESTAGNSPAVPYIIKALRELATAIENLEEEQCQIESVPISISILEKPHSQP